MKTNVPTVGPSDVPLDPALPAEPTPEGLDWDLWVGPASWRPYNSALMIANLCSYVLAQKLQRLPIYEALSRQDGITMPSAAHLPGPLTVEPAMRPLHLSGSA